MSLPAGFELDAYLARIGYAGARTPTLEALHAVAWHHATAIPFENLDVLLGHPIVLTPAAITAKLVHARRGGYCFEQTVSCCSRCARSASASRPSARAGAGSSRANSRRRARTCSCTCISRTAIG